MKRYCIVGMGGRGTNMYLRPLLSEYQDVAKVVGLCDISESRLNRVRSELNTDIPCFTDFDEMLRNVDFDVLIVTTKDSVHHEFIIKGLEADKDVITEKPMTIDAPKCRAILEAEAKSKGRVLVTFNYRYIPYATRFVELLRSGVIGTIHSIDFAWYLDTVHGANYFRRWHRRKENSGGLLVHKASHHFDLINWAVGHKPVRVYASGGRRFYGPTRSERGHRCSNCEYTRTCEFYKPGNTNTPQGRAFEDYYGDHCVFGGDIDIEDTLGLIVNYADGAQLHYSLHAYMPFEGFRAAFNGSKGRMEIGFVEAFVPEEKREFAARTQIRRAVDIYRAPLGDFSRPSAGEIRIYPMFGGMKVERVDLTTGGHGGGDCAMLDMLFKGLPDPLGHLADSTEGAMSILIGIAANESMTSGLPVDIHELLYRSGPQHKSA